LKSEVSGIKTKTEDMKFDFFILREGMMRSTNLSQKCDFSIRRNEVVILIAKKSEDQSCWLLRESSTLIVTLQRMLLIASKEAS